MAIKLHGAIGSTATFRVKACLAEKGIDYEFVTVDMGKKEHKSPQFLSRNPFGQVPAFEDGDLKLFESRAITQYLAHTYADKGTDLIIKDPKKMAIVAVWIEVESQKFDPVGSKLAWELAIKPMFGMTTDDAVVQENQKKLEEVLDVYESRLSESKYLGGDCFTLADLHHLPVVNYLMGTKVRGEGFKGLGGAPAPAAFFRRSVHVPIDAETERRTLITISRVSDFQFGVWRGREAGSDLLPARQRLPAAARQQISNPSDRIEVLVKIKKVISYVTQEKRKRCSTSEPDHLVNEVEVDLNHGIPDPNEVDLNHLERDPGKRLQKSSS